MRTRTAAALVTAASTAACAGTSSDPALEHTDVDVMVAMTTPVLS